MKQFNMSYSRYSCYLHCPYQHYLRYYEKIRSNKPARPLQFGGDFHKLLEVRGSKKKVKEVWRKIKDDYYRMPASWQEELGENYPEDIKTIFLDYVHYWKDTPIPDETEKEFWLTMLKEDDVEYVFHGFIDEIYKTENGKLILGEHKTFSRAPDTNNLVMNAQKSLYCLAVRMLYGKYPDKVQWDYIKSTPAKYPVWLEKSGRFSNAASKDITFRSWCRACKEHNILDPSIIRQAENYRGNEANYFFRVEQDVYPQMVEDIFNGFVYTTKDIYKRGEENTVKNVTRDCSWCEYCDICFAEMSGADRDYIIEQKFTKGE